MDKIVAVLASVKVEALAAERRKICSPRREPWELAMIERSAAERRKISDSDVSPLRG